MFCTQLIANNTVNDWYRSVSHIIGLIARNGFQIQGFWISAVNAKPFLESGNRATVSKAWLWRLHPFQV